MTELHLNGANGKGLSEGFLGRVGRLAARGELRAGSSVESHATPSGVEILPLIPFLFSECRHI